jgi:hypothetical protein
MIGNILSALVYVQSTNSVTSLIDVIIQLDQVHHVCLIHALPRYRRPKRRKRPTRYVRLPHCLLSLALTHNPPDSAILSDITSSANRSKALAHVGIAFAICFCIGPPIGAYFASRPPPSSLTAAAGWELNVYAVPAALSLVLLVLETVFLMVALPETRGQAIAGSAKKEELDTNGNGKATPASVQEVTQLSVPERLARLKTLRRAHFLFLAVFSGVEFTLTFLSFDRESLARLA